MQIFKRIFNLRGNLGSLFGGSTGNQVAGLTPPSYYTNPNFTQQQNNLSTLGTNILSGNLPSYYSSLGNPNSPQYNAVVQNTIGQTNAGSQQAAAASGTDRSGVAATAAAGGLASVLPSMNLENLYTAQGQQQGLLNLGTGLEENVEGNALSQMGQQNQFNQNTFEEQLQQSEYNNAFNMNAAQQQGQFYGSLISGGIGAGLGAQGGGGAGAMAGFSQGAGLGNFSNLLQGINNTSGGNSGTINFAGSSGLTSNTINPAAGISPAQMASLATLIAA